MPETKSHGGARRGAGRKSSPDRLIRIDARLSKSQIEFLKSIDLNLSKAIRTITDQRSEMSDQKVIWITQEQMREYQDLKQLMAELVKRYGWDHQAKLDDDTHPEVRAAKLVARKS